MMHARYRYLFGPFHNSFSPINNKFFKKIY